MDGLSKCNNPVSMGFDDLGLLGHCNRDPEQVPKVLGLFCVDIRGVVGSNNFGKVNCIFLDNVEPLVKEKVWTSRREVDLFDNIGGICCLVIKEVEALLHLWLEPCLKHC